MLFNPRRGEIEGIRESHPPGDRDRTLWEQCQGTLCIQPTRVKAHQ